MAHEAVYHIPALLEPTLEGLALQPSGRYVDATFGGGGHSRAIMSVLGSEGRLYGFDQDSDALAGAIDDSRFTMVYSNFRFLRNFLRYYGETQVDGVLADLGVSFHHFDDAERGFSFRADARLDMRMNQRSRVSAVEVLNEYTEEQLADVFYLYGELTQARRLARAIATARRSAAITQVSQLMAVAEPLLDRRRAKKELACVFQALRIEVNGELDALKEFLSQTAAVIRPGGRLAIITYHSLEDRLVKNFMRTGNFAGKVETDLFGRSERSFRPVGSKPTVADEAEIERNPRSRSAKLRVAERI